MHRIQKMMNPQQVEEPDGTRHVMAPIIVPKLATAASVQCLFASLAYWVDPRSDKPGVSKVKAVPDKEGIIARDKYEVGDFVSTYQFVVRTPGRLLSGYGRERRQNRFHGGTINLGYLTDDKGIPTRGVISPTRQSLLLSHIT